MDEENKYKIILRHDTSTNWTINNPTLAYGEYGIEDDTHRVKRGDGSTEWVNLTYETFGIDLTLEDLLLRDYVKKEDGKGLSEEDFTYDYKVKLDTLHNYDDAEVKASIHNYNIIEVNPAEGYSKSYSLTEDGIMKGVTINVPKDLVVTHGEVKTVTIDGNPYPEAKVGDKYICLTLNDENEDHIHIPVKDLIDIYEGVRGSKIAVTVTSANKISANIIPGSIELTDLTQEVQDKINAIKTEQEINDLIDAKIALITNAENVD